MRKKEKESLPFWDDAEVRASFRAHYLSALGFKTKQIELSSDEEVQDMLDDIFGATKAQKRKRNREKKKTS